MLSDLSYIAVVVLVPLIPAFLLYKFLPSGRTEVGGPFKGLDIKLSGAFAGYFLVVLIVTSLLVFLIKTKPSPPPCPVCPKPPATQYEVYTVTGKVDLERDPDSEKIDYKDLTLSLAPPERTVKPDGRFSFDIPVKPGQSGEPEFPDLIVGHEDPNYVPATIPLNENSPHNENKQQGFTVEYNKGAKTIVVKEAIRLAYPPPRRSRPEAIATPIP